MLKHWIWLTQRNGIGTRSCAQLLRMFGTAERIYALTEEECKKTEKFQKRWLEPILDKSTDSAEKVLEECDNKGIQIVTYADKLYPERLRNIPDPPALLYYKGVFPDFDAEAAIGVIGTRNCSTYGLLQAKQFGQQLATSGAIVVTGGARGIDTAAAGGALESMLPVVCVLGSGLDVIYPKENKRLFQEVTRHGCLISEYPPGTEALPTNFPVRNRIISGLSLGVLVIEAPKRSGALITANHALEQGRDVFAVPGNVGVRHCEGSNRLLREGACMATDGWEVLEEYVHLFPDKLADGRTKKALEKLHSARYGAALPVYSPVIFQDDKKVVDKPPVKAYIDEMDPTLTADEQAVLAVMESEALHSDVLIARSGVPAPRVLAALTLLQIKKRVEKQNGNYYQRI